MATKTKPWTLTELERLPNDGNRYELARGALFVTPAPSVPHELIAARLHNQLAPYVAKHDLGYVLRPRTVMMFDGSQVEPDLMVSQPHPEHDNPRWETAPTPSLIVEISSRTTERRDRNEKRALYLDAGVPEYWIVDRTARTFTVIKPATADEIVRDTMRWDPIGAPAALRFEVADVFGRKR